MDGTCRLDDCDILALAGGFAFGDDHAAGRVMAIDLTRRFGDQLRRVVEKHIPVIGICNGFQAQMETGLLPGDGEIGQPTAVLDHNVTARFEHWRFTPVVLHDPVDVGCVWTKGLDGAKIRLPSAHGQGFPVLPNGPDSYHVMATYGAYEGDSTYIGVGGSSPNGSKIAGLCTKYCAGLMPHPERSEDGLVIFEAGVNSVR
jgi:phosphoribosylformylglycinamidine synthase